MRPTIHRHKYFSYASNDNLARITFTSPMNFCRAARHQHSYESFGFSIYHRSHGRGARTRARSLCLADTAFPDPQLDGLPILNPYKHNVCAIRKLMMRFECSTNHTPVEGRKVESQWGPSRGHRLQRANCDVETLRPSTGVWLVEHSNASSVSGSHKRCVYTGSGSADHRAADLGTRCRRDRGFGHVFLRRGVAAMINGKTERLVTVLMPGGTAKFIGEVKVMRARLSITGVAEVNLWR